MATISKTQGISLLSLQEVLSNSVVVSAAQDVSTKMAATIFIHFGLTDTTGPLIDGVEFRVEASAKSTGNDQWYPLVSYKTYTAAPESEPVSGTVSSGANVVTVVSTTNLTVGDIVFIRNTTIGNSEWGRIKSVATNASITLIDALTNTQTGSTIYDLAEMYTCQVDLTSIYRLRLVADASNTGKAICTEAFMVTGDSIT